MISVFGRYLKSARFYLLAHMALGLCSLGVASLISWQFFRIGRFMMKWPEYTSVLWTNRLVTIELSIEALVLVGMIFLTVYFFRKVYRFVRGTPQSFPELEISRTLKILWILMALPLLLFFYLWGQRFFGPPIGFVGDFRNWAEQFRFLLIFLSYTSLLWYPFFLGLGLYFSYVAWISE